jgi:hypothetical protein
MIKVWTHSGMLLPYPLICDCSDKYGERTKRSSLFRRTTDGEEGETSLVASSKGNGRNEPTQTGENRFEEWGRVEREEKRSSSNFDVVKLSFVVNDGTDK